MCMTLGHLFLLAAWECSLKRACGQDAKSSHRVHDLVKLLSSSLGDVAGEIIVDRVQSLHVERRTLETQISPCLLEMQL